MSVTIKKTRRKKKKSATKREAGFVPVNDSARSMPTWGPDGWLAQLTSFKLGRNEQLAEHADWRGPTKLVRHGGAAVRQLTEVFMSRETFDNNMFDDTAENEQQVLMQSLSDTVFARSQQPWKCPSVEEISQWLVDAGYSPSTDESRNLRLTLKSRGCDGQIRIRCDDECLRLTMRIGSWRELESTAKRAMLQVAREANDRGRLARIAWIADEAGQRCEAQVDLTGLPTDKLAMKMWPDMMRMSVASLELCLRRLGMELDVLAEPKNVALAEELAE